MEAGGKGVPEVMVKVKVGDGESDVEGLFGRQEECVGVTEVLEVVVAVFKRDGIGISGDGLECGEGVSGGLVIREIVMDDGDGIGRRVFVVRGRDGSPVGVGIRSDG